MTVSPIVFTSNLGRARRLYICEIGDAPARPGNHPTLSDVKRILTADARDVPVWTVPQSQNQGDAWIQDQFQPGLCEVPGQVEEVVVHLPRMRTDIVQTGPIANLAGFVRQHFPARDVGLHEGLWARNVGEYSDRNSRTHPLNFEDSYRFQLVLDRGWRVWHLMRRVYVDYSDRTGLKTPALEQVLRHKRSSHMSDYRVALRKREHIWSLLTKFLKQVEAEAESDRGLGQALAADREVLEKALAAARSLQLDLSPGVLRGLRQITLPGAAPAGDALIPFESVNTFVDRLTVMHDSTNYGGNIEVSPPVAEAKLGKVVLGASGDRPADPELVSLLLAQGPAQPLVAIDTGLLDVAHVDEVLSFVPDRSGPDRAFAIAHADPATAVSLLKAALQVEIDALTRGLSTQGLFHTPMLRGKQWLFNGSQAEGPQLRPPRLHRVIGRVSYEEPRSGTRSYSAAASSAEVLDEAEEVNLDLQRELIKPVVEGMCPSEFPGIRLVPLPVLFDSDLPTSAYLPNAVNLQVVNDTLLVPYQFGLRMGLAGAVEVLDRVLPSDLRRGVSEAALRTAGLIGPWHWEPPRQERPPRVQFVLPDTQDPLDMGHEEIVRPRNPDAAHLAEMFSGGFHDLFDATPDRAEIQKLIIDANPTTFDPAGNFTRTGWQRVRIPENTVDIFEAYIYFRLSALGVKVRFVDSWYYHVRRGEIHCGTQVLYRPETTAKWWDAHATSSRSS